MPVMRVSMDERHRRGTRVASREDEPAHAARVQGRAGTCRSRPVFWYGMSPAHELDDALARVARGEGALDLGLGETLDGLFAGGRLLKAGYATERDYARERLGIPARTMYDALALGRVCAGRPLLRKAVASALVSPCKARAIAPVVGGTHSIPEYGT